MTRWKGTRTASCSVGVQVIAYIDKWHPGREAGPQSYGSLEACLVGDSRVAEGRFRQFPVRNTTSPERLDMKGLCKWALAVVVLAACGRDSAITGLDEPTSPNVPSSGGILAIGVDSVTGATIETNKDDYSPGEVVHVAGRGWAPGETVNLHMTEEPNTHADVDTNVVADGQGAFSIHYYDVQTHDIGVTFTLTVTGGTSGSVAIATFTDAINLRVTGKDGAQHDALADEEDLGSIGQGVTLALTCPRGTGLVVKAPGAGSSNFDWTLAYGGSGANNATLSSLTTLTPNSGTLNGSGDDECVEMSINTATLSAGATYHGSLQMTGTNANTETYFFRFSVTATSVATTTTISSSQDPSVTGESVTFTATVKVTATNAAVTTGSVTFRLGGSDCSSGTVIGSAQSLDGSGQASEGRSFLATEDNSTIRACYSGASGFNTSSGDMVQDVDKANVTVTVSDPASTNVGENVTFNVTIAPVAPGAGTPGGTVTFYDMGVGQSCASPPGSSLGSDNSAPYLLTTNALSAGSHLITACYGGDANFNANSGSDIHSVSLLATTTDITSLNNPSVTGQSTTYTATVTRTVGGAAVTSGSVSFKTGGTSCSNATALSGPTAVNGSGQATAGPYTYSATQSGLVVRACYTEGTTYADSEDDLTQVVNKANTSATATDSNDPSVFGQSITLGTAVTAVSPGTGTPTGNVKFWELTSGSCASPVGTQLGTTQALLGAGTASVNYSALSVGSHTITVCYLGDDNYNASSNTTTHMVDKAQSVLSLATNTPTTFGNSATFTATMSVASPGAGSPSGNVRFYDGGTCDVTTGLGTGTLLDTKAISSGEAVGSTSSLGAGSHTIVACYGGDASFLGDDDSKTHQVNPAASSTSIAVAPSSQQYSDKVVFTATVTPKSVAGSTQSGSVQFKVNTVSVGSPVTLDCSGTNCVATYTYTIAASASPPTLAVSAVFTSTNPNFNGSSSTTDATLTVTKEDASVYNESVAPSNILVGGTGTVSFNVRETNPETNSDLTLVAAGDISNAGVQITSQGILSGSNQLAFSSCTVGNNGMTGYNKILNVSCPFTSNAADTYDVTITITGNYYTGTGAAVVQITDPNAGFTTGGGWYWYDETNFPGEKVNFGFMAKTTTNNKKTVFQGSLLVIRHKADGSVVKVKSNVFEGYSIGSTDGNGCTPATFSGKATYSVNGTSEGNFAFTGYGLDCGEPGSSDKFSLYHAKSPNAVSTAASVGTLAASAKTIAGGNVQVPQPSRR